MCNAEGEGCEADVTRAVVVDEERHQLRARPAAAAAAAAAGDEGGPTAAAVAADLDEDLLQEEATSSGSLLSVDTLEQAKLLLSGGVAGAFSKSCTAPLARLTILYQVRAGLRDHTSCPLASSLCLFFVRACTGCVCHKEAF